MATSRGIALSVESIVNTSGGTWYPVGSRVCSEVCCSLRDLRTGRGCMYPWLSPAGILAVCLCLWLCICVSVYLCMCLCVSVSVCVCIYLYLVTLQELFMLKFEGGRCVAELITASPSLSPPSLAERLTVCHVLRVRHSCGRLSIVLRWFVFLVADRRRGWQRWRVQGISTLTSSRFLRSR